jgi:hypothetical protein
MKKKEKRLSIRELAKRLGKSPSAVRKWVTSSRWPFGAGPWAEADLSAITQWAAALQPNRAAGEVDAIELPSPSDSKLERKLKLKILAERGRILELDRKKKDAELVDRASVLQRETAQAMIVMNELLTIRTLAAKMEGAALQQREQVLETWARDTARKFENAVV